MLPLREGQRDGTGSEMEMKAGGQVARSIGNVFVPGGEHQMLRGRGTGGCSIGGSSVGFGPFRCCLGRHHLKLLGKIRNRPEIFGCNYEHRFNTLSLMEANFIRFVMRGATKRNEYFLSLIHI